MFDFDIESILYISMMFFGIAIILFVAEFIVYQEIFVDLDIKNKKLKKIIKQKNKEIQELKSIGNFIYTNYLDNKKVQK